MLTILSAINLRERIDRCSNRFEHAYENFQPCHREMRLSRDYHHGDIKNVNALELNSNILNIIPTRTITYDYDDEGARTKEVKLAGRRTRMLNSSIGLGYI